MVRQYRADIDGLRAIAVGGVVLFHAFPNALPGGFVGVDVFFVLSGFLITAIIRSEAEAGTFSLAGFYERRFRRIVPALAVVAIASTIAATVILPPDELRSYGKSLFGVALFASNIIFWQDSGYFDTASAEKPLLHTWSLAVEEQFYIVWPLIAVALVKLGRRRMLGGFVWATVVVSLLAATWAVQADPSQAFYLLPYRAWELGFGALLAVGAIPAFRSAKLCDAAAILGIALIVVPMALYTEATPFPGLAALPPCLGALLLIHAGQGHSTLVGRALSVKPVLFVGLTSYSFYLWHWPLLVFPRIALNRPLEVAEAAVAVLAAFALAAWSLRYVERPFRGRSGGFTMTRGQVLSASVACFAILGAGGLALVQTQGLRFLASPQVLAAERAVDDINPRRSRCHSAQLGTLSDPSDCTAGAPDRVAGYDVLLWGDSHADHLMPGLASYAGKNGFEVRQTSVSGCSPVTLYLHVGKNPGECAKLYDLALAEAARRPDTDTVVVSARWSSILPGIYEENGKDRAAAYRTFEDAIRFITARIDKSLPNARIILVGSTPEFSVWPATCLARAAKLGFGEDECDRIEPTDHEWGPQADRILAKFASDRVHVVLPRGRFCKGDICETELGGSVLFRDDDHLTNAGSRLVADEIMRNMSPVI
ncbi:acyltransferase family protein [Sphingomonas sp. CFBP 13720]|uniref:acyltransferase family protein n=1 Tax=Sphingomonas sp. CFBP 13720 TaxID=2775302 RepID=UPI00177F20A8|nr:acyltransferase family protein [Sphingomonas sp. CFBP 13720]MBD8679067.1 acyltransferase [Sphingomonas sp. CFBP 13720]